MMMQSLGATWMLLVALSGASGLALAQEQAPAPAAGGHWEGTIQTPGEGLKIAVDLARSGEKWEGTIDIPPQNLKAFPLADITVQAEKVTFAMPNVPGSPAFAGTVSKDGKQLAGEFRQGGQAFPFALVRSGDAKIERAPDSTPVTPELEGTWEGTLVANGQSLRLVLKLANKPGGGPAAGSLISLDQGGAEIPAAAVIQDAGLLEVLFPTIAGSYKGELKEGVLTGTWTQGAGTSPLTLKKRQP